VEKERHSNTHTNVFTNMPDTKRALMAVAHDDGEN
jgi:hypothetical protein